jgi:hypothetical protein
MSEYNKWTINQDGYAMWSYHFPISKNQEIENDYLNSLEYILTLGCETRFIILNEEKTELSFQHILQHFLEFMKKSYSRKGYYTPIFSAYPSNNLNEKNNSFYFSSAHWLYNNKGQITDYEVNYMNIRNILKKVGHPYNKSGIVPLMHMSSGINKNLNSEIIGYDFTFHLNSDLWAPKVPGIDYEREFTNDEIRQYGWDIRKNYWYSNLELAELNVVRLNSFMQKMLVFTKEIGGYCELNEGGLNIYEDILTNEGIVL